VLQAEIDLVADGLDLPWIGSGTDHEVVGEGSDAGEIENLDIGGLLGFGSADGEEPGRGLGFDRWDDVCLFQNTLL
jgi:hypothetical protein